MSLTSRIAQVIAAIGIDIKGLSVRLAAVEGGSNSPMPTINAATRLIQTQCIMAQTVLKGQSR